MLETILKIGGLLRQGDKKLSSDLIKHHRYFVAAPIKDVKNKREVQRYSVPVKDFVFDFSEQKSIDGDDDSLYYFRYKTSENDNQFRYIYGDIYYALDKDDKECGHYRTNPRSFLTTKKNDLAPFLKSELIEKFRDAFEKQVDEVECFLKNKAKAIKSDGTTKERGVFLHFLFEGDKKHWYERDEIEAIKRGIIETFFEQAGKRGCFR